MKTSDFPWKRNEKAINNYISVFSANKNQIKYFWILNEFLTFLPPSLLMNELTSFFEGIQNHKDVYKSIGGKILEFLIEYSSILWCSTA